MGTGVILDRIQKTRNYKKKVNNAHIMFAATATPRTIDDIKETLLLHNPKIIKRFHRENLNISINRKLDKQNDLNEIVVNKKVEKDDKVIIYCETKDDTDDFVLKFKGSRYKS